MKAECQLGCGTIEKPQWEHLIYEIRRLGGHAGTNKCPYCGHKGMLTYDLTTGKEEREDEMRS